MTDYLEVGDVVYHRSMDTLQYVGEISRVTKTLAFVRNIKFKREIIVGAYIRQPGSSQSSSSWGMNTYIRETPKIKKAYHTQVYLKYIQNRVHDLSYEDLENIFYQMKDLISSNTKTTE